MKSLYAAAGAICVVVLSACSTTPISADLASKVPSARTYGFQAAPSADAAKLVVTRDTGHNGSGCLVKFFLDGKPAADFEPAEVATFYHEPGQFVAEVKTWCGSANKEYGVLMKPGETQHFRIFMDVSSGLGFSPTAH